MLGKKLIKNITLSLSLMIGFSIATPVSAKTSFTGEYRKGEILSFGASLTNSEEAALRKYFGVSNDMKAIYVDNKTAIKQLGLAPNSLDNYTGGWYSSAHVVLTDKNGVKVTSKNVTKVTNEMFANALITSGILNAEVNVSAPFNVTGESALAGILAGAEEIMGDELPSENKEVAKDEIDTTLNIADEILNNSENNITSSGDSSIIASGIINDIKTQVIKDSPTTNEIRDIIINVTNNYGVALTSETNEEILSLMKDVKKLDIDYNDIKESMNNIGSNIKDELKGIGVQIKESGILEKMGDWFKNLFEDLFNFIKNLFESNEQPNENSEDIDLNKENESLDATIEETSSDSEIEENIKENNGEIEEEIPSEEKEEITKPSTEETNSKNEESTADSDTTTDLDKENSTNDSVSE